MKSISIDELTSRLRHFGLPKEVKTAEEAAFNATVLCAFEVALEGAQDQLGQAIYEIADPCDAVNAFSAWLGYMVDRLHTLADKYEQLYKEMQ